MEDGCSYATASNLVLTCELLRVPLQPWFACSVRTDILLGKHYARTCGNTPLWTALGNSPRTRNAHWYSSPMKEFPSLSYWKARSWLTRGSSHEEHHKGVLPFHSCLISSSMSQLQREGNTPFPFTCQSWKWGRRCKMPVNFICTLHRCPPSTTVNRYQISTRF